MHTYLKLKHTLFFLIAPGGALFSQTPAISEANFNVPIDYTTALKIAVERDPRLNGIEATLDAAVGKVVQAGLKPNPVVGGELENALGTGTFSGVQGVEVTLGIRQLIETADKRTKRTTLARRELDLVAWQRERVRAEIEADTRETFISVLLAQKIVTLRKEQLELAERSNAEVQKLVDAARSPQVDLTRSQLEIRQQKFALEQAERDLEATRNALASRWGLLPAPIFTVTGELVLEDNLPEFSELATSLSGTASLAQFGALTKSREAALDLEKARAKPDFEVFAGGRYLNQNDGDMGFVAGIEIPWPLFDKNQGNIRAARAKLRSVGHSRDAAHRALLVKLSRHFSQLANAHADAIIVETELLPAAEQTLTDTEAGYQRGQFGQLAVLESRQTLFKIREAHLEALTRYAKAQSAISAITRQSTIN
jgi:cobalt-zinc-cadmium efflux system outer membrane protein